MQSPDRGHVKGEGCGRRRLLLLVPVRFRATGMCQGSHPSHSSTVYILWFLPVFPSSLLEALAVFWTVVGYSLGESSSIFG